jgi:carbamoyl-phosphate synthase large subunit
MVHLHGFTDLEVWQRSMDLVDLTFECTKSLPRVEFDLKRQMRRAVTSMPTNVAEGYRRHRRLAYQNHISIALGSNAELFTEFEIAFRNQLMDRERCRPAIQLCDRVGAMLYRLHQSLEP